MILGAILNPINSSIIAVALVPIGAAFGAPASQTAWLVSALYVTTAIGQPLTGRLVDLFGPRRVYLVGTSLTGVAGVIGALAPGIGVLILARVILGLGTCAGYPVTMHLIRHEAKRTGRASPAGVLTAVAVATQTVSVLGPTLGGLLIDLGDWRLTFALNIPLALACLVLGWLYLPRETLAGEGCADSGGTEADAAGAGGTGLSGAEAGTTGAVSAGAGTARAGGARSTGGSLLVRLDPLGVALFSAALIALMFFLMALDAAHLWLLGTAAAAAALFTWRELRAAQPFIDVRVFASSAPLLVTYVRMTLTATVSYCFVYGFTQWLEEGRGLSPTLAGLMLLPTFATGIVGSALWGRKPGVRAKLLVGALAQAAGSALLFAVEPGAAIWLIVAVALVFGVPQGILNLAVQNTLYYQARDEFIGAASGLLRTFMYVGAIAASAATGLVYAAEVGTGGLHRLAVLMVAASALQVVITLADRSLLATDRQAVNGG
ncbi:MFS transporter [Brevibacterium sp. 5221]|uniref:MFS transporter n=2 Tax=Brevibacterium rongguiense TaxID=2695267 RepID=A0A6N9H6W2_9MICO|nr:MFS transporter [Brevibacterium rongguiense]